MKQDDPFKMMKRMKKPDEIFDLVCLANYMRGQFNGMVPVEESREVFDHIKKLLKKEASCE